MDIPRGARLRARGTSIVHSLVCSAPIAPSSRRVSERSVVRTSRHETPSTVTTRANVASALEASCVARGATRTVSCVPSSRVTVIVADDTVTEPSDGTSQRSPTRLRRDGPKKPARAPYRLLKSNASSRNVYENRSIARPSRSTTGSCSPVPARINSVDPGAMNGPERSPSSATARRTSTSISLT